MTEPFRSAVAYRNDFCATTAQLEQRMTRPLPAGATVYVTGDAALYRLEKNLGTIYDDVTSIVVVPADGSRNRWIKELADGASPFAGTEIALASVNVTPSAQAQWTALGSTAGSFELASGDETLFQVGATSSVLFYHGPQRLMRISYQVSLLNGGASGACVLHAALSVDSDIVAGSTTEHRDAGEQVATVTDTVVANICGERTALLSDHSTVRLMLRNLSDGKIMSVLFASISVAPA